MAIGSGIGIGGLASGLDTNAIVQKLVQLESLPIAQLETKRQGQVDKQSAINKLKSLIKDLQNKAKAVSKQADFLSWDVKASKEGVATFSANGNATATSHSLEVTRLASVDRWAFDGVSDPEAERATGPGQTLSFDVGGETFVIEATQGESSLNDIAAAINTAASDYVRATVVNTGTESSPSYKLVMTAKSSGEEGRITNITNGIGGLVIDATPPTAEGETSSRSNLTVGNNAQALVDGLLVERTTNEFTGVIEGITFTAQGTNVDEPITFSATANKTAIKKKVQDLVDSYNAVINFANTQNTYTEEVGTGGVLFGDSVLSSVRSSISKALFDVPLDQVTGDTSGYATLSIVGIKSNSDGTLTIDSSKLDDKLDGDLQAFANLFVDTDGFDNGGAEPNTPGYYTDTTADSGLADKLNRSIERMFATTQGPGGTALRGLFDSRLDTISKAIRTIDKDLVNKRAFVDRYENDLIQKFARLERTMGQLNSQGAGFAAAIAGLNG